jgi:hypothetical protein
MPADRSPDSCSIKRAAGNPLHLHSPLRAYNSLALVVLRVASGGLRVSLSKGPPPVRAWNKRSTSSCAWPDIARRQVQNLIFMTRPHIEPFFTS